MSSSKVLIVTGASRGVGLAISQYLLTHSHRLVVVARSEPPLRALEKQYPDQVAVLAGDVADFSLGKKAVDLAQRRWMTLDGLVLNHGVLDPVTRIADADVESWRKAYDVTFFSAVAMAKEAIRPLRESKGKIVMVSSGAATRAYISWGAYGSSKAAMNHLAMTIANEEKDIIAIAVHPGRVDTEMQRDIREKHHGVMDASDRDAFAAAKADGTLLKPEQPGHVIAKLVLDAPKELNGKFLAWNSDELKVFRD